MEYRISILEERIEQLKRQREWDKEQLEQRFEMRIDHEVKLAKIQVYGRMVCALIAIFWPLVIVACIKNGHAP